MNEELIQKKKELKETVIGYVEGVVDGGIIAGKKLKNACHRFLKDLSKTENESFPYYVDWTELLKIYVWARMFKHRKGVLAGQPIDPEPFQLFLLTNILCFKHKDTDYKRYREIYIQLARKNAKSQLLAIITSYISFNSIESQECYITGYAKEQSQLVYDEVLGQIERTSFLEGKFNSSYGRIKVLKNDSVIKALSRESKKFGDGTSPSFVVVDEYHTHPDDEIVDIQRTGMMARSNPQIVYITTAGFNIQSPCKGYYDHAAKIIDPSNSLDNEEMFVAIFETDQGDDIKDEKIWEKANPLLVTYKEGMNSLRSDLKMALDRPEKMRAFLTKNMNIWVDQKDNGFLNMKKWKACQVEQKDVEAFMKEANVYIGIDASLTTDLTSVGWVGVKDGKFAAMQHSFVPEEKFRERISRDKVRYDVYEEQGYMTKTPGAYVDIRYMQSYVEDLCRKYNVKEIGYDKYNLTHFATDMESKGYPMIEIPQSIVQLSAPTKRLREEVYGTNFMQEGDPLLELALYNAVTKTDLQENMMISKQKSTERIDPAAAIVNAFARAMYDDQNVDLNSYILSDDFSF